MSATEAAVASAANSGGGGGGSSLAEVVESGRVLAQLNDWRAITFVLVIVIVCLLFERYWSNRDMRVERRDMMAMATATAENAGEVAQALSALRVEVMAFRITAARVESVTSTLHANNQQELKGE